MKKKIILLSLIAMAGITVAFVSKPKPPTFQQELETLISFIDQKELLLAEVATNQDSLNIISQVDAAVTTFTGNWDVQTEAERLPNFPFIGCVINAISDYSFCNKPVYPVQCHNTFTNYIKMCKRVYLD